MMIREHDFMKSNGCSEKHINNNLKTIMNFDASLDPKISLLQIKRRDLISLVKHLLRLLHIENSPCAII